MSGSFNPINMVSQIALAAATGGASLIGQLAMQVASQFGQQLIQQLGEGLGLPQSVIDLAQGAFSTALGNAQGGAQNLDDAVAAFGQGTGGSPADVGNWQREMQDTLRQVVSQMSESEDFKEAKASRGKSGSNAPGWLMAMAKVLGEKLDSLGEEMQMRAEAISEKDASSSAEFGVVSQQFSMLMNATNNAIKTVGEALAGMARKQ